MYYEVESILTRNFTKSLGPLACINEIIHLLSIMYMSEISVQVALSNQGTDAPMDQLFPITMEEATSLNFSCFGCWDSQ